MTNLHHTTLSELKKTGFNTNKLESKFKFKDSDQISYIQILETYGIKEALYMLRADLHSNAKQTEALLACDIVEIVLPIFEKEYPNDKRPRDAINAIRTWALNPTKENEKKRKEAASAAYSAYYAAYYTAYASASYAAARNADLASNNKQELWKDITNLFKKYYDVPATATVAETNTTLNETDRLLLEKRIVSYCCGNSKRFEEINIYETCVSTHELSCVLVGIGTSFAVFVKNKDGKFVVVDKSDGGFGLVEDNDSIRYIPVYLANRILDSFKNRSANYLNFIRGTVLE